MTVEMFGLQAAAKPLKGKFCKIPSIHSRAWMTISDQSPCGNFIRICGGNVRHPRWIAVKDALHIRDGRKAAK